MFLCHLFLIYVAFAALKNMLVNSSDDGKHLQVLIILFGYIVYYCD